MQRPASANWTEHRGRGDSLMPGFPFMRLRPILHRYRNGLAHWEDAVAESKAFAQFQDRVAGTQGVFDVDLSDEGSTDGYRRPREFSVIVRTRTPVTKEVEHYIDYLVIRVNARYETNMKVRILFTPA